MRVFFFFLRPPLSECNRGLFRFETDNIRHVYVRISFATERRIYYILFFRSIIGHRTSAPLRALLSPKEMRQHSGITNSFLDCTLRDLPLAAEIHGAKRIKHFLRGFYRQ